MIADHVQRFFREIIFADRVHVLVVAPRHIHVVETASFFVNTELVCILGLASGLSSKNSW